MVEVAEKAAEAAWKIKNLEDYDQRLERAARVVDELSRSQETAALVIYEAALMKSGRPREEVRDLVRRFQETWEDEEELLTIPRVSGIMNVEGDEWFFGDESLKTMTGRLLGQFQHRVAQYNYVDEREVLKRWANSHDTRLFIRRRIPETEPVVGVIPGFGLFLMQYLRVAAGGDTVVLSEELSTVMGSLGFGEGDEYDTLARAENLALHLDLPAPIAGAILEDIARDGLSRFPEPPETTVANETEESGEPSGEEQDQRPSGEDRAARRDTREDPEKGEEPTRVQDPQASDAPGTPEERWRNADSSQGRQG
ncbi:MAG: hypothetical protein ACR2GU_06455 [Rubrobacteraceae bacterium]